MEVGNYLSAERRVLVDVPYLVTAEVFGGAV